MNKEFIIALEELEKTKNVDKRIILEALEKALVKSYQKNFDNNENVDVSIDDETGEIEVYSLKNVVEEVNEPIAEISKTKAKEIDPKLDLGDICRVKIAPKNFGRVAAQTARNIVIQKIRDAQRDSVYSEYLDRANEIITGVVQREDKFNVYINLDKIEGIIPIKEQVENETYTPNQRIKVLIKEVKNTTKEPQIILSRKDKALVVRLFELEVPEITNGIIEIYGIDREAGSRTKIAVFSNDPEIDSIGACIGFKGSRVNSIVEELQGEKIDIIIPVPISEERKLERGFNQMENLLECLGIKYKKIERIKNTKHMYALKDNEKREKNVEKAFKNSLNLENKNVLIVDDIVTSGATINSISEELRKDNENINIKVFSIAIARHFIME